MIMSLKDIIITDDFKATVPNPQKVARALHFYQDNGYFKKNIFINDKNELVDGYVVYLIAKHLGIKDIIVVKTDDGIEKQYVFGKHPGQYGNKEYVFVMPVEYTTVELVKGQEITVRAKGKPTPFIVDHTELLTTPPRQFVNQVLSWKD